MINSPEQPPPWIVYPDSAPFWGGWRQGESEAWLLEIWLPFWNSLPSEGRLKYLNKWEAPTEWREHVLNYWS
jgi:hypothetical protein